MGGRWEVSTAQSSDPGLRPHPLGENKQDPHTPAVHSLHARTAHTPHNTHTHTHTHTPTHTHTHTATHTPTHTHHPPPHPHTKPPSAGFRLEGEKEKRELWVPFPER